MNASTHDQQLRVLLITDGKPGHLNQLKGLLAQLQAHCDVHAEWLDLHAQPMSTWALWKQARQSAPVDIVIGAGHRTHKAVLLLGRHAFTCLLMKPSLPISWFDACVIPRHDQPRHSEAILVTDGVLNTVRPKPADRPVSGQGLLLIGGASKHYAFDSESIQTQIEAILAQSSGHWVLTDSRRTPADFLAQLEQRLAQAGLSSAIRLYPHQETEPDWLPTQYQQADAIWVTPDSVSMVYESLTSGNPVGLFDLSPQKSSRIASGISALIEQHQVTPFAHWALTHSLHAPAAPFCEADRAATWLLSRYQQHAAHTGKSPTRG